MLKEKRFDYSNDIVDFGFKYKAKKKCKMSLDKIINSVKKNIIIYDFNNLVLSKIVSEGSDLLNDQSRLFIALTSENEIKNLKDAGVKTGFIRSTKVYATGAIIIVDKTTMYFAVTPDIIFEGYKNALNEVFNYINYLIWNTTSYEILQGNMSPVKGIRHSVVKPVFDKLKYRTDVQQLQLIAATNDFDSSSLTSYINKEDEVINSILIDSSVNSIVRSSRTAFVNAFDDIFLQVKYDDCIEEAESFASEKLSSLVGESIWISGKKLVIDDNYKIDKLIELPFDEYKEFNPNYGEYIPKSHVGKHLTIDVKVNISPLKIDESYNKSTRYKKREDLFFRIDKEVDKLIKIFDEEQKQLNQIKSEPRLNEKAKMYNDFIDKHEVGLKPLKAKKHKKSFKKIVFNEKDVTVPNELLGVLFEKAKKLYFALDNEKNIKKAKEFIKSNNLEAILVQQ